MSYDGYVEYDGEDVAYLGNYTSNVVEMWRAALGFSLRETSGWPVRLAEFVLSQCAQVMHADPAKFKAMDPPNGWGDYYGALRYVEDAAAVCKPFRDDAVIRWST